MQYHRDHSVWIIISQLIPSVTSLSHSNASLSSLTLHWLSNVLHYWLSEFSCCSSRVKEIHRGHDFLHNTTLKKKTNSHKTLLPRSSSRKHVLLSSAHWCQISTRVKARVIVTLTQSWLYATVWNVDLSHLTILNPFCISELQLKEGKEFGRDHRSASSEIRIRIIQVWFQSLYSPY